MSRRLYPEKQPLEQKGTPMTQPTTLPDASVLKLPPGPRVTSVERPRPLGSLIASARRLTERSLTRAGSNAKGWQDDAWEMYDLVGEERFLASTLAGRLSQARLYVGKLADDPTEDPEMVDDESIKGILEAVGGTGVSRSQLVNRMGINLFVAGDGWLVGIPRHLFPATLLPSRSLDPERYVDENIAETGLLDIEDLEWRMLSVSEVSSKGAGLVKIQLGEAEGETIEISPDEVFLVRVWRPHPRKAWEADSPTRSSLPVLRELVGLTMHVSAQVDSRLAGAGVFVVPQSAKRALLVAMGLPEDSDEDPLTDALVEAMVTPISDRSSAAAVVPLILTVPDESADKFQHITFSSTLDTEARNLRDEAIRRLALGQDAPPELLLGTGGMNHWGAWLVREDVVTTHLEPPLALICDALTTQYLWPVLLDQNMPEDQVKKYVIWYDVSDLMVRPNHSQDAFELHTRGALNDEALRRETGFDEGDAPWFDQQLVKLPDHIRLAFEMVQATPSLAATPGLPALAAAIEATIKNDLPETGPPPGLEGQAGNADNLPTTPPGMPGPNGMPQPVPATQGQPAAPETGPPGLAAGGRYATITPMAIRYRDAPSPGPTAAQIVDAFYATEHGREFIDGYLDGLDEAMRETYGGPGSGRYPKGSGKHPKGEARQARAYPSISRSQLSNPDTPRTRAVSADEFQQLAATGRTELAQMRRNTSPPTALDERFEEIAAKGYEATREPWGGATIDGHTGEFLAPDADVFVVTVKPPGVPSVTVSPDASPEEFTAAMAEARQRFGTELAFENHQLGLFHDDDLKRIDIDPVLVLDNVAQVDTIGAYTHAVGGAYNPKTGDGYWPPYVGEE